MQDEIPQFAPKIPWWRRVPSLRRLVLFTLLFCALGFVALIVGLTYVKHMAPIMGATGSGFSKPITDFVDQPGTISFPQGRQRMNILVLGVDYNHDQKGMPYTKGARTDTMMV